MTDDEMLTEFLELSPLTCPTGDLEAFARRWGAQASNRLLPQFEKGYVHRGHTIHARAEGNPAGRAAALENLGRINLELRTALGVTDWPEATPANLSDQNLRLLFEGERREARDIGAGLTQLSGPERTLPPHPTDLFGRLRQAARARGLAAASANPPVVH